MEVGPQPAHLALRLFARALGVQLHQALQHGLGIRIGGQAVGLQHRCIQLVMQLAQHAHQALGVDGFFFGRKRLAFAQRGQHVVQASQGQARVATLRRQHFFAVGVDLLGELADSLAQRGREAGVFVREGEGLEAAGFDIDRIVANA